MNLKRLRVKSSLPTHNAIRSEQSASWPSTNPSFSKYPPWLLVSGRKAFFWVFNCYIATYVFILIASSSLHFLSLPPKYGISWSIGLGLLLFSVNSVSFRKTIYTDGFPRCFFTDDSHIYSFRCSLPFLGFSPVFLTTPKIFLLDISLLSQILQIFLRSELIFALKQLYPFSVPVSQALWIGVFPDPS